MIRFYGVIFCLVASASLASAQVPELVLHEPEVSTSSVLFDADDPAIWVNTAEPEKSLILGTDKGTFPNGGIYVWNMDGSLQQRINVSHPNNIDVITGLKLATETVDIAVASMRDFHEIYVYKIDAVTRQLSDITSREGIRVFPEPYGLTLYKRPSDSAVYAFVSSKDFSNRKNIWQLRLEDDGTGLVAGTLVRKFGAHTGIVEGMVADPELGYFYAAEEDRGIHKYYADPDMGDTRLAFFSSGDSAVHYESLAIYRSGPKTGYLLASNNVSESIQVFLREGDDGKPHQHSLAFEIRRANSRGGDNDGIAVTSEPLGPAFPDGLLIWHQGFRKRFQLYSWQDMVRHHLALDSDSPTPVGGSTSSPVVNSVSLLRNYPNPFNPVTTISYELLRSGYVRLEVFSLNGSRVRTLVDGVMDRGLHHAVWDGRNEDGMPLPSGTYAYRLHSGQDLQTKTMTLMK